MLSPNPLESFFNSILLGSILPAALAGDLLLKKILLGISF